MERFLNLLMEFGLNIVASIVCYVIFSIQKYSLGKIILWLLVINIILMILVHVISWDVAPEEKRRRKIVTGILIAMFAVLFCILVLIPKTNDWLHDTNIQTETLKPTEGVIDIATSVPADISETPFIPTQDEIVEEFRNKEMDNSWFLVPPELVEEPEPPISSPNFVEQGFIPSDSGLELLLETDIYNSNIIGITKILPDEDVRIEMTFQHISYTTGSNEAGHIYLSFCDSLDKAGYPKCVKNFLNITYLPNKKTPSYYFGGEEYQNVQNKDGELEIVCNKANGKVECYFPSLISSGPKGINQPKSVPIHNDINSIFLSYDLPKKTRLDAEITHFVIEIVK